MYLLRLFLGALLGQPQTKIEGDIPPPPPKP